MFRIALAVVVFGLMLLAGCGTDKPFDNTQAAGGQKLNSALVELAQVSAPAGTDPLVFELLQAKLAAALESLCVSKFTSAPPSDDRSQAVLSFNQDTSELSWYCYCTGDYNQDGMVTVNDITPLGQNFNAVGPFDPVTAVSCVDGDQNGVINVSDITPIGQNFNRSLTGYNIYVSLSAADYPTSNSAGNGSATLLAMLPYPSTAATGERKSCSYPLADPQPAAYVWVRPTDGGSEGTPSNRVQLPGSQNIPPVAAISADPNSGDAPLTVDFDASLSHDPDGVIVKYEWDWTGYVDGWQWVDTGTTATAQHVFDAAGSYETIVRVTDNLGEQDNEFTTVTVTTAGNDPPEAALVVNPNTGDAPLDVDLDASGSSDPDGTIVKYEWDWDGDGTYELDSGTTSNAAHTYSAGNYSATVRVTDNDGAMDTDVKAVNVGGGTAEWHIFTVYDDSQVTYALLIEANGRPGIVYYEDDAEQISFLRADDALGTTWDGTPVSIGDDYFDFMKALDSVGNPAVIYFCIDGLVFVRANDANGDSWADPVVCGHPNDIGYNYGAAVIDGNPAVSYGVFGSELDGFVYHRANDMSGGSWPDPQLIQAYTPTMMDMQDIGSVPGICVEDTEDSSLSYFWAANASGTSWNKVSVDPWVWVGFFPKLQFVDGRPAIQYIDWLPESVTPLYFIRAENASGSSWDSENRVLIDELPFGLTANDFAVIAGRPAATYIGGSETKYVHFKHALYSDGSSWPAVSDKIITVDSIATASLADINGMPGIAICNQDLATIDVLFAVYY